MVSDGVLSEIDWNKKLTKDKKKRFALAPDGWSSSGGDNDSEEKDFVQKKKKRPLKLSKGGKEKRACVSSSSRFSGYNE